MRTRRKPFYIQIQVSGTFVSFTLALFVSINMDIFVLSWNNLFFFLSLSPSPSIGTIQGHRCATLNSGKISVVSQGWLGWNLKKKIQKGKKKKELCSSCFFFVWKVEWTCFEVRVKKPIRGGEKGEGDFCLLSNNRVRTCLLSSWSALRR